MMWALHIGNILVLCSFLVKDISLLRVLSITAGIFFSIYFLTQSPAEYPPVYWNMTFALVNIVQIFTSFYHKRKLPLGHEEVFLQQQYFSSLQAVEIRQLYQLAQSEQLKQGQSLENGHYNDQLCVIVSGKVILQSNQDNVLLCEAGHFLGVQNYLTQSASSFPGKAVEATVCLTWNREALNSWTQTSQQRHNLLLAALSKDLLHKMKSKQAALSEISGS